MKAIAHRAMLLTPMRLALVAAVMVWGGLTPPALAKPVSDPPARDDGMISGTYAAALPDLYLRDSAGRTGVCIKVTGTIVIPSNPNIRPTTGSARGEIWVQRHRLPEDTDHNDLDRWSRLATGPSLTLESGERTPHRYDRNNNFALIPAKGGNENCDFYSSNQPTNWCRANRTFNQHGWEGRLTADSRHLRVQVNNRYLKMHGSRWLAYGGTCPPSS